MEEKMQPFAMTGHRPLDDQLTTLRELLTQTFDLVDEQLAGATRAVLERDVELAQHIHERDDDVDAMELEIDALCERVLARNAPVALDLRTLLTAVKVNTDLERIGDHAKNLAKSTPPLAGWGEMLDQTRLPELAEAARSTLNGARDAFLNRNADHARQVIEDDEQTDRLHQENTDRIARLCREYPEEGQVLCDLVAMNNDLERIGDHATNIAESIVFWIEGEDIRHQDLQRAEGLPGRASS